MMMSSFELLEPEAGFTSDVIRDPNRFVGRSDLLENAMRAVNANNSLIAVYGKRGVGKSSLMRQIQLLANGDYSIIQRAGLYHLKPQRPRNYYTVFYTCDSSVRNIEDLLRRICTDSDPQDGLLRLVPSKGKELQNFSRSKQENGAMDLKIVKWGSNGTDVDNYASNFSADIIQSFRNFTSSILPHNNSMWKSIFGVSRDGLLIFIDEFDVIQDKTGIGSLFKSLSSDSLKFAISGISDDLGELIEDHASIERLIEQGHAHVRPMSLEETGQIFATASTLFHRQITFPGDIIKDIHEISLGFPYFAQLIGKKCVEVRNKMGNPNVDAQVYNHVKEGIRSGDAFPQLELKYRRAIGDSEDRALILTLLAEEKVEVSQTGGGISLKNIRAAAQDLDVQYIDQLLPRLIDKKFGPALVKMEAIRGTYEFLDPVFRAYVKLRK